MTASAPRPRRLVAAMVMLAVAAVACGGPGGGGDVVVATPRAQDLGPASGTPGPTSTTTPTTGVPPSQPSPRPTRPLGTVPPPAPSEPEAPARTPDLPTGIDDPVRLEIPAIDVDARLVGLSLGRGDPEVPTRWEDAGWYETTRNPGEIGPAVVAGHIDSRAGPAVFHRLDELEPGDEVIVHGSDGVRRTFVVEGRGQYPKTALPDEVFGFGQARPELRLITCGGSFDAAVGHYVDNLVVYARGA